MAKKKPVEFDYNTAAKPRTVTVDGVPVFCAHDKLVDLPKVIPNPGNPNQHPPEQIKALAAIIASTGWRLPITVSKRSGFVVKGHGRLQAAALKGWTQVPVDYQDYASEAEEYADLIADNRLAELSRVDNKMLVDLINEMDSGEIPIEMTGYTEDDIEAILAALSGEGDSEDDGSDGDGQLAGTSDFTMTQAGDLWLLGGHRLICGSATDAATIERLMDGEKAQMVNTDPPYGVSYTGCADKSKVWAPLENDELTGDNLLKELLMPSFKNYVAHTKEDAAFYIWHASSTRRDFEDAMTAAGLVEKQYIIWVKNHFVMGRNDYQWKHEPCFYAEKAGHTAKWTGDRSQTTTWLATLRGENEMGTTLTGGVVLTDGQGGTVYISEKPPRGKKIRYIRLKNGKPVYLYTEDKQSTVWEVTKDTQIEHPTQKPVELAIRAITNSSEPGDVVVDFFAGSGSTLLGAEMAGRRCYSVELSPHYCDLIVKRYVKQTGNAAVLCERDGERIPYMRLAAQLEAEEAEAKVKAKPSEE
ncbi:MAG: site-specific DNA-methyltransferase [Ruminococcus sp.]